LIDMAWDPGGVQGEADRQRVLLDVEAVAGHLLPAGSVFAFLAEHRFELFPAGMFADLFPSGRGRPSIPPDVIASVIVLQALYGYSDREAADAVTFDLRWKAACGYAIDAAGSTPRRWPTGGAGWRPASVRSGSSWRSAA
jgi:hypothetical protein